MLEKCEFCENWEFAYLDLVKNEILKMWISLKIRLWNCEFCKKWDFQTVNFWINCGQYDYLVGGQDGDLVAFSPPYFTLYEPILDTGHPTGLFSVVGLRSRLGFECQRHIEKLCGVGVRTHILVFEGHDEMRSHQLPFDDSKVETKAVS